MVVHIGTHNFTPTACFPGRHPSKHQALSHTLHASVTAREELYTFRYMLYTEKENWSRLMKMHAFSVV